MILISLLSFYEPQQGEWTTSIQCSCIIRIICYRVKLLSGASGSLACARCDYDLRIGGCLPRTRLTSRGVGAGGDPADALVVGVVDVVAANDSDLVVATGARAACAAVTRI